MARFLHDVRFALRGFRRNPGVTLVTILVLAVGIGANTAIFSVVDALVLRPLPFPSPQELTTLPGGVMYPDFVDLRAQARSLRSLAVYRPIQPLLSSPGEPQLVNAVDASADLFDVLGVRALLGRTFEAGEDQPGRGRVAVMSHAFWRQRLGGDPEAVGRTVTVNGQSVLVVGVMPAGFRFPLDEDPADLWFTQEPQFREQRQWRGYRASRAIGRLAHGVDLAAAQAEVAAIGARLAKLYPKENAGRTLSLAPYDHSVKTGRVAFLLLLVAAGVVLLVACANVANLQLVRASARRREMAIRAALGAGQARIIGQLLTESLVLTTVAGGLGVAAAFAGVDLLVGLLPDDVAIINAIAFDHRVLVYTLAASLGTAVVVGLAPAMQLGRANLVAGLSSGGRGTTPGRRSLRALILVSEVALAVVLLAGAGLLLRSYSRILAVDPGFETRSLLVARVNVSGTPPGPVLFYQELLRRLQALPGVRGAAFAREMPYGPVFNSWNFSLDDRPPPPAANPWWANARGVSVGYFSTLGIPVLQGRAFAQADIPLPGQPMRAAVVNEAFARRYWPGGNPLGHHIRAYERDVAIIGVVADTRGTCDLAGCSGAGKGNLDRAPVPEIYLPNNAFSTAYIAVRASGISTDSLVTPLRTTVQSLKRDVLLDDVHTMEGAIDESLD